MTIINSLPWYIQTIILIYTALSALAFLDCLLIPRRISHFLEAKTNYFNELTKIAKGEK